MSKSAGTLFNTLKHASAALAQNIGWSVWMNPSGGGHSAQAFGLPGGINVNYQQGSPAMASAEIVVLGRPFIPVGRPFFQPMSPGANSFAGALPFGAGINWAYGSDGGAAKFSWNIDSEDWQLVDEVLSPNQANVQIANKPGGATWLLTVQIITNVPGSVTLFADGVSKGPLADGDQVPVTGQVISLGIQVEFPTPSQPGIQDGFSVGYVLQQQ